ncbi:hypothetical protein [Labilibaculum sp.]|uniref:hypothetical protein n=1 Tax=Labilibaculum sp. TaxID=2060723 RepID=UPI003568BFB7
MDKNLIDFHKVFLPASGLVKGEKMSLFSHIGVFFAPFLHLLWYDVALVQAFAEQSTYNYITEHDSSIY